MLKRNLSSAEEYILQKAVAHRYKFKPYSKEFPKVFAREKKILLKHLKEISGAVVEHVGSTAVHGVGGKGIVDIAIFVPKKLLPKAKKAIQFAGFEYQANWRRRRFFFSKYYLDEKKPCMVHAHLTAEKKELHKLTSLAKYLQGNKKEREWYESHKRKASKLYWKDAEKYRKFKRKYLSKLAKRALKSSSNSSA